MSQIDKQLKKLRIERDMTQQEIADILNVHQATYNCWEKGKSKPDIDTVLKIATLYKTSTDYLLGRYESA
ncbi:hypothetical protein FACS189425_09720 [Clostridia bacterium]|nr:hypothetical protein FACS189425_09720 [Clostridia bacterium]